MRLLIGLAIAIALGALGLVVAGLVGAARDRAALAAVLSDAAPDMRADLPPVGGGLSPGAGLRGRRHGGRATLTQEVEMILREGVPWQPMGAVQAISAGRPAFAWVGDGARGTRAAVHRDRPLRSRGWGPAGGAPARAVPIVRQEGPATDLGEAMRYLAELPWAPDAILRNPALEREALDGNGAGLHGNRARGRASGGADLRRGGGH